jgi:hypothetical protein
MCHSIKVVYFGCLDGEQHYEWEVVRCQGGLEWQLYLPVNEPCEGCKQVEDWRMSPCNFCANYLESRKNLPKARHTRAFSMPALESTDTEMTDAGDLPDSTQGSC